MTVSVMNQPNEVNLHHSLFAKTHHQQQNHQYFLKAQGFIPRGSCSVPINPDSFVNGYEDVYKSDASSCVGNKATVLRMRVNDARNLELLNTKEIQQEEEEAVKLMETDLRSMRKNSSSHWVRALRLADDCHGYNVQLKLEDGKVYLQTVRDINDGQELVLWFSEDVLAIMQMGFLTLANIRGQKQYVCTKCSAQFETPNPLKLHLTLQCDRKPLETIWIRFANKLTSSYQKHSSTNKFEFKLYPRTNPQLDVNFASNPKTLPNSPYLYRPFSEPPGLYGSTSAFKPFRKDEVNCKPTSLNNNNNALKESRSIGGGSLNTFPTYLTETLWSPSSSPTVASSSSPTNASLQQLQQSHLMHEVVVDSQAAHIEALVSSLGKSKQGHYCLYCGKCYSRKYGLKIHIRTHTGYKPLKCKFCARPFGDPSNLNKHVRLHAEGETPYRCELCGKILVRRRDLERHLKSRHMNDMHPGSSTINITDDSEEDISEDDIIV